MNPSEAGAHPPALAWAGGLGLAATPVFAVMAALTAMQGAPAELLCGAASPALPIGGMAPMYALMSAFHCGPWLNRISGRKRVAASPPSRGPSMD